MSYPIAVTLMFFSAIGFAGAGVGWAVARAREVTEAETDVGMRAVTGLLLFFGIACAYVPGGFAGVLAFGSVVTGFSYFASAHRLGIVRIEEIRPQAGQLAERRRIA